MLQLKLELKRVQTFIFDVPRLKAMLGANALIGQTMRHELPGLIAGKGQALEWPEKLIHQYPQDPLNHTADPDDPSALFAKGILARDGGHFMAVFTDKERAQDFLRQAETVLAERLPGVLYDASISPFPPPPVPERPAIGPRETALLDLPVLQVCQETGSAPASDPQPKVLGRWQARSVTHRQQWGDDFYSGKTKDIIGLLRPILYPDKDRGWKEPGDLAQLTAGGYLALIHADGNGIGKRYNEWKAKANACDDLGKEAHGEAFFHSMRVAVRRAVVDALASTFPAPNKVGETRPYEILMLGGDDLLLICRADRALAFAIHYAAELEKHKLADGKPLHVAMGVAIAQKTYPLHRLHELAEGLATSAKRLYRSWGDDKKRSVIDWQVVTQSWFEGVAKARQQTERIVYTLDQGQQETLLLTGRPYPLTGKEGLAALMAAEQQLDNEEGAARSPLRSLRGACERGRLAGEMAFAQLPKRIQTQLGWQRDEKSFLWDIRDYVEVPKTKQFHLTRALDIIGIHEIGRLGRTQHD